MQAEMGTVTDIGRKGLRPVQAVSSLTPWKQEYKLKEANHKHRYWSACTYKYLFFVCFALVTVSHGLIRT